MIVATTDFTALIEALEAVVERLAAARQAPDPLRWRRPEQLWPQMIQSKGTGRWKSHSARR